MLINWLEQYITMLHKNKEERAIRKMVARLTLYPGEVNQLHHLEKQIIDHVTYDVNAKNRFTAYGALVDHRAVCEGISKAVVKVCSRLNIEAVVIYNAKETHALNGIKLDDMWYLLDVTYDMQSNSEAAFLKGKDNALFLNPIYAGVTNLDEIDLCSYDYIE